MKNTCSKPITHYYPSCTVNKKCLISKCKNATLFKRINTFSLEKCLANDYFTFTKTCVDKHTDTYACYHATILPKPTSSSTYFNYIFMFYYIINPTGNKQEMPPFCVFIAKHVLHLSSVCYI